MKKILPFILVFACILCLVGCGEKAYELPHDQFCYTKDKSQVVELKAGVKEHIVDILNHASWVDGLTYCASDFIFYTQKQEVLYHSECGTLNDTTNQKSTTVSEEERTIINHALGISDSTKPIQLTGFAEFLDGERFVTGLGQGAFLSQMEKYSHNGIKITGGIFHYDGAYGGGCAGGNGDDFRFSNDYTVTDDGKHATYSNTLRTTIPLEGLTLPYGITFGDTLTTVLNKLELCIDIDIQSGFVSDKGRPGTMTLLSDSISSLEFINCLLLPEASGKPLYNFEIQYKENDKAARKDGRPSDVTRYIIMSFTDDNHKLGCLEMAVIERYELR